MMIMTVLAALLASWQVPVHGSLHPENVSLKDDIVIMFLMQSDHIVILFLMQCKGSYCRAIK